jgi:hypothetical protein
VQRVEEKVWMDLRTQRGQLRAGGNRLARATVASACAARADAVAAYVGPATNT